MNQIVKDGLANGIVIASTVVIGYLSLKLAQKLYGPIEVRIK